MPPPLPSLALALVSVALAGPPSAHAQEIPMDAATLAHRLDRLASTARVLYVAAHPDDENTRLLAYLANVRHAHAAYLSMTRGGGGQNLIGSEQRELLDVIRTEELLAARRLDGARQRFTRAVDFGYSKRADEALAIWGHDEILSDVVWVVRTFQPDVIITRFNEEPPNHGHHTASAILAREAFEAAADPGRFPEQLRRGARPWQARRLLHNLSSWRNPTVPPDALTVDVGPYDPRLGLSMGELAALSRSQHKSQGFGASGERGRLLEHFVTVAGVAPEGDLLDGVELGWSRFGAPGRAVGDALEQARVALHRDAPEGAIPALARAHRLLDDLEDDPRVRDARADVAEVLAACAGLYLRATAERPTVTPGEDLPVELEVVLRRPAPGVAIEQVVFPDQAPAALERPLALDDRQTVKRVVRVPEDAPISSPIWLAQAPAPGRHHLSDPRWIGQPSGPPPLAVGVEVAFEGRKVLLELPVVYSWRDRVHGERVRTVLVHPPATVTPVRNAVLFPNRRPGPVHLRVHAAGALEAEVRLDLPRGWKAQPPAHALRFDEATGETTVRFDVTPPSGGGEQVAEIVPVLRVGQRTWSVREDVIDYPHIPMQVVLQPARIRAVAADLQVPGGLVGYVPGSGDTVAEDLAHVGARVEIVDEETLLAGDLGRYAALVLGIRAYNTRPVLRGVHGRLMDYVAAGGTLVVQYNTTSRWDVLDAPLGPYPLELGRGRVTDERAAVKAIDPSHPVLTTPNRITARDYEGWVQERGLYFAERWDERYQPVLRMQDPGEEPQSGALLVARHGRGRFVYTGLSFFRQLPAGIPGAYRLFSNLIANESTHDN